MVYFRKDPLKAIKAVNRNVVQMCQEMKLFGAEEASMEGTLMHGHASKGRIFRREPLEKEAVKLEKAIDHYLAELEHSDPSDTDLPSHEDKPLSEKLERLKERQTTCQERLKKLDDSDEKQL